MKSKQRIINEYIVSGVKVEGQIMVISNMKRELECSL